MLAHAISRRAMVSASTLGISGWQFGRPQLSAEAASNSGNARPTARSTILFFLCGGASHLDLWDLKPQAPLEYRGPFQPIPTTVPGLQISEHLPLLAQQAHHLTLLPSVGGTVNTNDHHAGYYYNLTGHVPDQTFLTKGNNRTPYPDDWPFMGSVVSSRRPKHPYLPNAITLPHMPSRAPYTRPGQFAARIGLEHDPLYVHGSQEEPLKFSAPSLELLPGTNPGRVDSRRQLLSSLDETRRQFDQVAATQTWTKQQDRAFSLLVSSQTIQAFDVASEPVEVRERYGHSANGTSLLMARRLVEAGVPFITVFWIENSKLASKCRSAGGWDTHGNNFNCLKEDLLPVFDRGFSALIADLSARGLLDETLLLVTSEMGRKPKIGDPRSGGVNGAGRDHWTHCLTDVMAGGGLRGGQIYGSSDRLGEYPADKPITPAHVTKTVYHAMGITNLEATDPQGRPYNLLDEGEPLRELFA